MYENYLLDASAVAGVMNAIEDFRPKRVSKEELEALFNSKGKEKKKLGGTQLRYFCEGISEVPPDWRNRIDAAKLLEDLFKELSDARVDFRKTTHSVALTQWLIGNNPEHLREVAGWLVKLLPEKDNVEG